MAPLRLTGFLLGAAGVFGLSVEESTSENSKSLRAKIEHMNSALEAARSDYEESQAPELKPSLSPKSDNKFFGKDYPDDLRPTIDAHPKWTYPYPKVQSDAKFDADYVKDENNDGGHWKAQMDYDEVKMKYVKQQAVVRKAALDEGMSHDEAMKAAKVKDEVWLRKSAADAEASKALNEASEATAEANNATWEEKATEEEKKAWEEAKKAGKSKAIFEAEQKVERAELNLKDCEKAVTDAKAELANAQVLDDKKRAEEGKAKAEGVQAAKGKSAGKTDAALSKNATLADKKAKAAASAAEADAAKTAAEKEQADDEVAKRTLAQEQTKLDRLHSEMSEAEKRLREYRGEPARAAELGAEGGHSGASRFSAGLLGLAISAALLA